MFWSNNTKWHVFRHFFSPRKLKSNHFLNKWIGTLLIMFRSLQFWVFDPLAGFYILDSFPINVVKPALFPISTKGFHQSDWIINHSIVSRISPFLPVSFKTALYSGSHINVLKECHSFWQSYQEITWSRLITWPHVDRGSRHGNTAVEFQETQ